MESACTALQRLRYDDAPKLSVWRGVSGVSVSWVEVVWSDEWRVDGEMDTSCCRGAAIHTPLHHPPHYPDPSVVGGDNCHLFNRESSWIEVRHVSELWQDWRNHEIAQSGWQNIFLERFRTCGNECNKSPSINSEAIYPLMQYLQSTKLSI